MSGVELAAGCSMYCGEMLNLSLNIGLGLGALVTCLIWSITLLCLRSKRSVK